jgi:hypothetical protein
MDFALQFVNFMLVFVSVVALVFPLYLFFRILRNINNSSAKKKTSAMPYDEGIRELIREGKREEALKAYQTFTNTSEEDARIEIERLEWEENVGRSVRSK